MIFIPALLLALAASILHRNRKEKDVKASKDADITWSRLYRHQEGVDHAGIE